MVSLLANFITDKRYSHPDKNVTDYYMIELAAYVDDNVDPEVRNIDLIVLKEAVKVGFRQKFF